MRFTPSRRLARTARAFTLTELLVTAALALLVSGMLLGAFFFGNRMWQITQTKISATDMSRRIVRLLTADVHAAKNVRVGTGSATSFTEAPVDTPQQGNAIQIYPTVSSNYFIRYYLDSGDKKLKWMTNGAGAPVVLATSVSNSVVFRIEDFTGNVLTSKQNNCVVGLTLDFSKIENPGVSVGPGCYYRSFRIATKVAKRAL
jgi:hypothetical protein